MEATKLVVIDGGKRPEPPGDYIQQVFGSDGFLAKAMPSYRPRDGQIALARSIDRGIREGRHVIGEGPCGVGKSFAYSVPAVYHSVFNGKRVCIVTANKNLQRQIYQKDLADLARTVPWQFKYAIRKGHSSYLCLRNFEADSWQEVLRENPEYQEVIDATVEWAGSTSTGDFEDSPGPPPKAWAAFSTSREDCDGRKCRNFEDCFAKAARDRAVGAHVIVTNYHLFFLHLKLGPESKILPAFDVVILDEAHNAANIAREFFGQELTFGAIYRCAAPLHMVDVRGFKAKAAKLRDEVMKLTNIMWHELAARARAKRHIFRNTDALNSEPLEAVLIDVAKLYAAAADALDPPGETRSAAAAAKGSEAENWRKLSRRSAEKSAILAEFRTVGNEYVTYFIEGSGNEEKGKYVKLKSKAVEVGGYLRRSMFERYPTVVQTSATLMVRGGQDGDFGYLRREMGMNKMGDLESIIAEEIAVESPFNWGRQALLVIPRSMPEFVHGSTKWDDAVCEHLEQAVNAARGRTLGLFTSYRMMRLAAEHLRKRTKWRVLMQGEATNRELAAQFQTDVGSVLLGTESFSEGVSIEGEACTCVVLDKVPFLNQDDPVIQALELRMKARGSRDSVFQTHMLPEAIISFKQRVGRLIRTVTDVGVVVMLDKRLLTKPYRTQFLKSIPPIRKEESMDAIEPFLRGVGAL